MPKVIGSTTKQTALQQKTHGLTKDTLKVFEGIPIYTFIAGRGIYATENPAQSAREFKEEIKRIWG